jgi:hypothetical protein
MSSSADLRTNTLCQSTCSTCAASPTTRLIRFENENGEAFTIFP